MKRFVLVTMVGYFEIDENDLENAYQAKTIEEAVQKQRDWLEEDPGTPFEELVNTSLPTSTELKLMSEGFSPI